MDNNTNIHQFITEHNSNIEYVKKTMLLKQCNLNYWSKNIIDCSKIKQYFNHNESKLNDIITNKYISYSEGNAIYYIKNGYMCKIEYNTNNELIESNLFLINSRGSGVCSLISYEVIRFEIINIPHYNLFGILAKKDNQYVIVYIQNIEVNSNPNDYIELSYPTFGNVICVDVETEETINLLLNLVCLNILPIFMPESYNESTISIRQNDAIYEDKYNITEITEYSDYFNKLIFPEVINSNNELITLTPYMSVILSNKNNTQIIQGTFVFNGMIHEHTYTLSSELFSNGIQPKISDKNTNVYIIDLQIGAQSQSYIVNSPTYLYYYFSNPIWNEVKINKTTKQYTITQLNGDTVYYQNNYIIIYDKHFQYYNIHGKIFKIYNNTDIESIPVALSKYYVSKHLFVGNSKLTRVNAGANIIVDEEIICQKEFYENI